MKKIQEITGLSKITKQEQQSINGGTPGGPHGSLVQFCEGTGIWTGIVSIRYNRLEHTCHHTTLEHVEGFPYLKSL